MLTIHIKDASVETATLNGPRGSFQSSSQTGWLDLPSGERRKVRVSLARDAKPYVAGAYTLSDDSFTVGQYGDLQLERSLKLVPVQVPQSPQRQA